MVTLTGHVASDADKGRANQIAESMAAGQVVANEVAVTPPNDSGVVKTVNSDLDKGIANNLDAALLSNGYKRGIHHSVKNGVVTLLPGRWRHRKSAETAADHRSKCTGIPSRW